jgi:hypothetical protein
MGTECLAQYVTDSTSGEDFRITTKSCSMCAGMMVSLCGIIHDYIPIHCLLLCNMFHERSDYPIRSEQDSMGSVGHA